MKRSFARIAVMALSGLLGAGGARATPPAAKEPDFGWSAIEQPTDASLTLKAPIYALGNLGRVDVFDTRHYKLICRIAPPINGPLEDQGMALSPDGKTTVNAWGGPFVRALQIRDAASGRVRDASGVWRQSAGTPGAVTR